MMALADDPDFAFCDQTGEHELTALPTSFGQGHDAACRTRDQDFLNRWPLALEIYRIAADGPQEWSVRVGIYGEWGSGKSSVLNFIESMASKDGHVVFHFNPWQYHSKEALWKAFVDGLFSKVEKELGQPVAGGIKRTAKKVGSTVSGALPKIVSLWREDVGKATETGLELLKRYLCFSAGDLKELKSALNGKRLIVCIDDLDRTDGRLVPEILFALKEIMDIPGMAFLCAFDPVVVGRVLGQAHPGHEDGLKFLDKIIDYPRWLSTPTTKQLAELAVSHATLICPYVPSDDLREVVTLLPKNPRSIRQFIRLLDLLRPQIDRHYPHEINWPILLTANIVKVVYPQIAHEILEDVTFWHHVYQTSFFDEKKEEQRTLIEKKVEGVAAPKDVPDPAKIGDGLQACVTAIAKRLSAWLGISPEELQYQFHIAEAPSAVTWKEFDEFIRGLDKTPSAKQIIAWIDVHERKVGHPAAQILSKLLHICLEARKRLLGKAADETSERNVTPCLREASKLLKVAEVMVLEIGRGSGALFRVDAEHMQRIFDNFAYYFHWRRTPGYRQARKAEERFLRALFASSPDDIQPWVKIIGLEASLHREDGSIEWKSLLGKFRSQLRDRCAKWLIHQIPINGEIRRTVFDEENNGYQFRELFFDLNGPVWTTRRKELLKSLAPKAGNTILQSNAYELLTWLFYLTRQGSEGAQKAKEVLSQKDFSLQLWRACVAEPLNPRAIGSLREEHEYLLKNGIECKTPAWWNRIVKDLPPLKSS